MTRKHFRLWGGKVESEEEEGKMKTNRASANGSASIARVGRTGAGGPRAEMGKITIFDLDLQDHH